MRYLATILFASLCWITAALGQPSNPPLILIGSPVVGTCTNGNNIFNNNGVVGCQSPSSGLTVGTTTITSGTSTRVLFDNAGVLGEYPITGTGNVVMSTSPTLVTPTLGAASATSINGLTITSSTGTLTITNAKTLSASNSLTLAGTDGKTLTLTNGLTVTTNDGTIAFGAASKTLSINNSLTLAGTDSTTMTFPSTSATIARTDAGQTFTGTQVFSAISQTASSAAYVNTANGLPAIVNVSQTVIAGENLGTPTLTADGQAWLYKSGGGGLNLQGRGSSSDMTVVNQAGNFVFGIPSNSQHLQVNNVIDFTNNSDLGIARNGAGILEINSTTTGQFRDLKARGLISNGTTFANLPATTNGTVAYVTDGLAGNCGDTSCTTFGTTVTGGTGSLKLLVWRNGSNWTLIGK